MYIITYIFTLREYPLLLHWKPELMHDTPKASMNATGFFLSFGKKFLIHGKIGVFS